MDGITGIVLGVIFGLVTLVLGILNYVNKKNEREEQKTIKQTELEIQLANIQKELIEIKALLVSNADEYKALEKCTNENYSALDKRVFLLENKKDK